MRDAAPAQPGQQRYLWRLGTWLASAGHEVHLLTVRGQPGEVPVPPGARLHRLDRLTRADLVRHVGSLELEVLMLNPERSRRYRGVRANLLRSGYGTEHYVQKLRSFRGRLELAVRRGLRRAPWVIAEQRWERAFYEDRTPPPQVIAQSEYMKRQILGSYAVPADHVHVVHNAVDLREFSVERRGALREEARARWSLPPEALCLLFLGHNFRLKGLWQLLRLLPSVSGGSVSEYDGGHADEEPGGDLVPRYASGQAGGAPIHLLVVGRGTGGRQRRKARKLIEQHGLGDRVTLAGPVASSIDALAAADALLHLSWHDSFGFVALEAMACGLPVVTTRYAGASELIEDGVSGLLVEPEDDDGIRAAIGTLRDPAVRADMGRKAAAVATKHDEPSNFRAVERIALRAADESPLGDR